MSGRYYDRRKESRSHDKDVSRRNKEPQRRRDQHRHKDKSRSKDKKDYRNHHSRPVDKSRNDSNRFKQGSRRQRSRSISSSSSSSRSSYSESRSRSRSRSKSGKKYQRHVDDRGKKRSYDRNRGRSRSKSANRNPKRIDYYEDKRDYKKYDKNKRDQKREQKRDQRRERDREVGRNEEDWKKERDKKQEKGLNYNNKNTHGSSQNIGKYYQDEQKNGNRNKYDDNKYEVKYETNWKTKQKQMKNESVQSIGEQSKKFNQNNITSNIQKDYSNQTKFVNHNTSQKYVIVQQQKPQQTKMEQEPISKKTVSSFEKNAPTILPQPIKRTEQEVLKLPAKQKLSKFTQLLNESKKSLQIEPLQTNFLILDSFRTMKKFSAQILDPVLLSWIQKDFEVNLQKQKSKVFASEFVIGQERQNAWVTIPRDPTDEQLSIRTQMESLKSLIFELSHSFRLLHMHQ